MLYANVSPAFVHQSIVSVKIRWAWTTQRPSMEYYSSIVPVNICLFKVNKRNTQNLRRSNAFIVNFEYNSLHFLMILLLNVNRKMFIGIASCDYDTIFIKCIINFYIYFFQTIKRICALECL